MELTPFDQMISSQNTQILKALLPYMPSDTQKLIAIVVKFSELQYTLNLFQNWSELVQIQNFEKHKTSPLDIIHEIHPYLPQDASTMLDHFSNMMNTMEMIKTFQTMSDTDDSSDSFFDPMSMMKTMLTPEQEDMFDTYQTMFTVNKDSLSEEGGEENDRLVE